MVCLSVFAGGNCFWRREVSQMLSKTHPGGSAGGSGRTKGNRDASERMRKKSGNTDAGKASFLTAASCVLQHQAFLCGRLGPICCSHSSFLQVPLLDSCKVVTWMPYMLVLPPHGRWWYQDKLCSGSPAVDARWCFLDRHKDKANFFLTQLGFHKLSCYCRGERWYHNDSLIIHCTFHRRFISIFFMQMRRARLPASWPNITLRPCEKTIKVLFPLWLTALNAGCVHNREEFTP